MYHCQTSGSNTTFCPQPEDIGELPPSSSVVCQGRQEELLLDDHLEQESEDEVSMTAICHTGPLEQVLAREPLVSLGL